MNPKPQRERLSRGKAVTICAAAIQQKNYASTATINIVFDQQLTLGGGVLSSDNSVWKMRKINNKWFVLFSGDTSSLFALRDAVIDSAQYETKTEVRKFARICSKAFREERKLIVETDILAKYDIESYAAYLALKEDHRPFFDAITKEISKTEEDWSLLFAGFDDIDQPHIFVISGFGKIQFCDIEGYAAIGSGFWTAMTALADYPYIKHLPPGEAIYSLLAAKFAAEVADGVGESTAFLMFRADNRNRSIPGLRPPAIDEIRKKWEKLPRIPDGVAETLEEELPNAFRFRFALPRPRKKKK